MLKTIRSVQILVRTLIPARVNFLQQGESKEITNGHSAMITNMFKSGHYNELHNHILKQWDYSFEQDLKDLAPS